MVQSLFIAYIKSNSRAIRVFFNGETSMPLDLSGFIEETPVPFQMIPPLGYACHLARGLIILPLTFAIGGSPIILFEHGIQVIFLKTPTIWPLT